ncbi:MAG: aminotransferase class I/II-fold pyridoxal phosphate-dependent enzyme [Flavobacteriaceae bacterium]|jgi:glycine C-acetyltransferase|nr:aminotransferase class I/II-fold pyridoxal phosphate-dependent enzyme [Flavobacteriaceae bacterium]MBT4112628.1 aminotransferase class I/II-fold pyridoxal phosphate-dependent enzyme [Flavobacteriaceae bacterium]MBT4614482.1 aminotransferase class I/II-fold pyridoxal phosphate-dependent enzyme [Flavobacteriaceae bacterium]MBT5246935.1 aminotransferase class I/II-fold pyridoxal phosphate-dependent enzyme [Flavobacteriaceae bacterium]MBT5650119.1 aminotransferase class I/II-fold pyridoxal phosp
MKDLFEKMYNDKSPLGKWANVVEGYFAFPKLEGEISNRMKFQGKEVITWSVNDYLGLANHPDIRKTDAEAAKLYGSAYPMGARLMSGHTLLHEKLEKELAEFSNKESAYVLNFGYQGILSTIDSLLGKNDVVVYDMDSHACIVDGVRLHLGKRFTYKHNDISSLEKNLNRASKITAHTGGGVLVISEGVFGMRGEQGRLKEITDLKDKYNFRLLVDDAHGFGTLGATGAGAGEEQGVQDKIDVYFATFAKALASTGAFISSKKEVIDYLKYNMRSQVFAKSLQIQLVVGILKRLEILRSMPEIKNKLWENVNELQSGLKQRGFNIGSTQSCVTPVYLKGDMPEAMALVKDLRENHLIFCSIVIYPVVPKGVILLRLIPTASHNSKDIQDTLEAFSIIADRLDSGIYKKLSENHKI